MTTTDAVVIGAGISGAATALELADSGMSVILLDRWGPAAMGSGWTLAGVRQSGRHKAELPLARAAVRQWVHLAERLGGETHYRQDGNLRLARTEEEVGVIETLVDEQSAAGLDVVLLRGPEVQAVAPAVNPGVLCACHCATDGHADPIATVEAFVAAGRRAGVVTRFGERALTLQTHAGRITGVRTDKGVIHAGHVVVAAGVFGNELLDPLGLHVPIAVTQVSVMRSAPLPPVLAQVIGVANADCAGRQQVDGRFRVTANSQPFTGTVQDGARPSVRPPARALAMIVERFGQAVPAFLDAEIEAVWSGLLDMAPDALPVLDQAPVDGLVIGMGFSGHGFCLGPVTGQILAGLVRGEAPGFDLAPFRYDRFEGWNAPMEKVSLHG